MDEVAGVFAMLKRHEVQVLRKAGHSLEDVARLTGVSERAVRRIEREAPVSTADDAAERRRRRVGRPNKAEPFRAFVEEQLAVEPDLLTLELLRRAKLRGYTGGKSAFYALVASARPPEQRPMVRFEGVPGEFSQHDFGHVDVRFVSGEKRRVHFFASRLKYSRWVEVSFVDSEAVEPLVRSLVDHFSRFGGVPLVAVFDRPKTIALKWRKDGEVTDWNSTFAAVMLELGVGVEVCFPRRPNQKGSVENLVGWVKGSFFKQRRFVDEEDLRQQLADWHVEVNSRVTSRATGVTHAARMVEERARLRPLKVKPDTLALRIPVVVGPTAMVSHDTHMYSMPPEAIGITGTLFLHRDKVRLVAGRHEAIHPRLFSRGAKSVLPAHRAAMVASVSGKRGRRYLKRQHLLDIGPVALEYLTEIVHRRPRTWARDVERLHDILQEYGEDLMREAMTLAYKERLFGAEYVSHLLAGTPRPDPWSFSDNADDSLRDPH